MNILEEYPDIAMLDEDVHGGIFSLTGSKIRGVKLCVPNQVNLDRIWHPLYRLVHLNGMLRKSTLRRLRPVSRYSIRDLSELNRVSCVCVLRDPVVNLDAMKRRGRLRLRVRCAMWRHVIEMMETMDARSGWDVTFLSFENPVRAPEERIRRLCKRLSLPFHERMLDAPRFNHRYPGCRFDAGRARSGGANGADFPAAEELGLVPACLAADERLLERPFEPRTLARLVSAFAPEAAHRKEYVAEGCLQVTR